jgi:hypothetical protein
MNATVLENQVSSSFRRVTVSSRRLTVPSSRARVALLWGVLLFAGGQAGLTWSMEQWRPELSDPEYGRKLAHLREQMNAGPANRPLVLALGSSRVAMGFRPDVLDSTSAKQTIVFNYALVGSGPVMELCCLRRLLSDGVRPQAVLVECWPPFWYQENGYAEENRLHVNRLGWSDLCLLCDYSLRSRELVHSWWQSRILPAYFGRFVLMNLLVPCWLSPHNRMDSNWRDLDEWGWLACPYPRNAESYRIRLDQAHQYYAPIFEQFRISEVADRAHHELLTLCRREGIAVALVLMPESSEFRGWYPAPVQDQVDAYLAGLKQEFGVRIIDARTWATDGDLLDGFHLMPQGAAAYTQRLCRKALPFLLNNKTEIEEQTNP